jgi:predicted O-methyltransferase YrrM
MKNEFLLDSEPLLEYIANLSVNETLAQRNLRERTAHLELAIMQISPIQAQFLKFILQITKAKNCLEIGTFCGYSSLVIAETIPADGKLITCDINERWTTYAKESWVDANVSNKVTLKLADANQTLGELLSHSADSFDFIFIDADKTNYPDYYDKCFQLCRPGGMIIVDNIFWEGKVLEQNSNCRQTKSIQQLNESIKNDNRVNRSIVPIADGLFLVQKLDNTS